MTDGRDDTFLLEKHATQQQHQQFAAKLHAHNRMSVRVREHLGVGAESFQVTVEPLSNFILGQDVVVKFTHTLSSPQRSILDYYVFAMDYSGTTLGLITDRHQVYDFDVNGTLPLHAPCM